MRGGSDGGGGDDDGGSDGELEKQLTSTLAWKQPATAQQNLKSMRKRARQLQKVAEQKKVRQEQKGKDARKAKRQKMSLGQSVQATLAAAADWEDAFGKLTVAKLTSLGTALGMESVPKGKKAEVAAAVEPIVREWVDARPATRAGND